jgi:hypothetical protein
MKDLSGAIPGRHGKYVGASAGAGEWKPPEKLSEEDLIRKFISQYPWAKGLDPRYIQYLIANPKELQKLLAGKTEI